MGSGEGFGLGHRAAILGTTALVALPGGGRAEGLTADEQAFLALSRRLTGRDALDPITAGRIYACLATLPGFASDCAALERSRRRIVTAWYLGVAGDGPGATVVAYADALMFAVVGEVVATPSYCRTGPGAWTAKPPAA